MNVFLELLLLYYKMSFFTTEIMKGKDSLGSSECLCNSPLDVTVIYRLLLCSGGGFNPVSIQSKPG